MKEEIKVSWCVALDQPAIRNNPIPVNLSPVLRFVCVENGQISRSVLIRTVKCAVSDYFCYLLGGDRLPALTICISLVELVLPAHLLMCYWQQRTLPRAVVDASSGSNTEPKLPNPDMPVFFILTSHAEQTNGPNSFFRHLFLNSFWAAVNFFH